MLAVISAIIVMIPLCKYLFHRRGTEEKETVTAKVEGTKVKSKKNASHCHTTKCHAHCVRQLYHKNFHYHLSATRRCGFGFDA